MLALELFPLNVEALLDVGSRQFVEPVAGDGLAGIAKQAQLMLSFNPGDARLYSLLGEAERRRSRQDDARAAFNRSLALTKTELHALHWALAQTQEAGDSRSLVDQMDALLRRWPDEIRASAPAIAMSFAAGERYDMLVQRLSVMPPWRSTLISKLAGNQATAVFAAQLLQDLAANASAVRPGEISNVVNGLLNAGKFEEAYRTFILTLSSKQLEVLGNVYDGRFTLPSTGTPFDWQIRDHPGVMFSYPGLHPGAPGHGMTLEFQQAPVRDLQVRQYLHLPAGNYALSLHATASAAVLPKGLLWSVRCVGSNAVFAELPIDQGSYPDHELSVDFSVPPNRCPIQMLRLSTKAVTNSWNDRYHGSLRFDAIKIVTRP